MIISITTLKGTPNIASDVRELIDTLINDFSDITNKISRKILNKHKRLSYIYKTYFSGNCKKSH